MKFRFIYTTTLLLFLGTLFMSSSGGRNDARANFPGEGFCGNCHGSTPLDGSIVLTGAPTSYVAGTTYPLTLTLTNSAALVGGFQIVATDGSIGTQVGTFSTPAGTRLNPLNRLVQDAPLAFSGGSATWTFNWTAPASGAPANVQFYFAGNAANNNGNTGGDFAFSGNSAAIPLPVELSQFDVKSINDDTQVKVAWQTQSEKNSKHFEIQRSTQTDETDFETIGRVDAAGNAEWVNNYEFVDESPLWNEYGYYRLKQVDNNGDFTFSTIQSIKIAREQAVSIYPNPIRKGEQLNIEWTDTQNQIEGIRILNLNGQVVYDNQNELASEQFSMDVFDFPIGVYFLSVYKQNEIIEMKKIIIQD